MNSVFNNIFGRSPPPPEVVPPLPPPPPSTSVAIPPLPPPLEVVPPPDENSKRAIFLLFGKKINNARGLKRDYISFLEEVANNTDQELDRKSIKDLKTLVIEYAKDKNIFAQLNEQTIIEIYELNDVWKTNFYEIKAGGYDFFTELTDEQINNCLDLIRERFITTDTPSIKNLQEIKFPDRYLEKFNSELTNIFNTDYSIKSRAPFYPFIYYFIYLCTQYKKNLVLDFAMNVIITDDNQINFAEMTEIFGSEPSKPDARQLLAIQRFTKFRDQYDKASFMFHGVGTGKTITSLLICLSNLQSNNRKKFNKEFAAELKPLKVLIIAPQGLFFTSFVNDARKLGIYIYNSSRVELENRTSIETCTGYYAMDHETIIENDVKKITSAYQIDFTSYDYDAIKENGFKPLTDGYDVLICDEAHRLLTTNLKPLTTAEIDQYKQINSVPQQTITIGEIETPIQYKYINYTIPYEDDANKLGLQWVREQVIPSTEPLQTAPMENPSIIREYRFLEFIVTKIKIQSIFLTGTPFQKDTLDISDIAMFLNHPAINKSNNADFMKFFITMGRVKIFNVRDVYDVPVDWRKRPLMNLAKSVGETKEFLSKVQLPPISAVGGANTTSITDTISVSEQSDLDVLNLDEKDDLGRVNLPPYNLNSFYESFPITEMKNDKDRLTYYGYYHKVVEEKFLVPNAIEIINDPTLSDVEKAQSIAMLIFNASNGYFKLVEETKPKSTIPGRTYDLDIDEIVGQAGGTFPLLIALFPYVQTLGLGVAGAFAGFKTDAVIFSLIWTSLQLYVSSSKTFTEKLQEFGPTYAAGPILGTMTSGIAGVTNIIWSNGYVWTLFMGCASLFVMMILATNTLEYKKKLENKQYYLSFFVRFWYRVFMFIRATTHSMEHTGSRLIYTGVVTTVTSVIDFGTRFMDLGGEGDGRGAFIQNAISRLTQTVVQTGRDVKESAAPAVDALVISPANALLILPYLLCDILFNLIPPVNVDDAIKYTQPYCSVYNYEYNEYAIKDSEFEIETFNQNVTKPVNRNGNKNRFPRQYIEQYLVPFTNEQTDLLNADPNPDNQKENNIGCGLIVDFTEDKIKELSEYARDTMTNLTTQITWYSANKIYSDYVQIKEKTVGDGPEQRTPLNIVNNNINKEHPLFNVVLEKVNELKTKFGIIGNDELKSKFIPVSQDNSTQDYRFQHMLLLLKIIRCGAIFKNGEYLLQPHYVKKNDSYEYFLPIVYPSTISQLWGVCNFLKENGERFLLLNYLDDKSIQNVFKAGQILTFPISSETNANPLCIIISPSHMEGFSYVYNPVIFEIGLCNTYGDEKQVDGRIYRKYPEEYSKITDERFDKMVYRYFGGSLYDIEYFEQLIQLYQTDELQKFRYGYNLIEQFLKTGKSIPEPLVSRGFFEPITYQAMRLVTRPITTAIQEMKLPAPLQDIASGIHATLNVQANLPQSETSVESYVSPEQKKQIFKILQRKAYNEEIHLAQIQKVKGICAEYFKGFLVNENKPNLKFMPLDLSLLKLKGDDNSYVTKYYKVSSPSAPAVFSDVGFGPRSFLPRVRRLADLLVGTGGKSKRKRTLIRFKKTRQNKPKKQKVSRKKHNVRNHKRTLKKVKR
jgi:hypothetical protein